MPLVNEYKCSKCGLSLPSGCGVYLYVENVAGARVLCPHPGESGIIGWVFGRDASIDEIRNKSGFFSHCICLDCLYQFDADLGEEGYSPCGSNIDNRTNKEKDKRECPKCNSNSVKTVLELVEKSCPKCKEGIIMVRRLGISDKGVNNAKTR